MCKKKTCLCTLKWYQYRNPPILKASINAGIYIQIVSVQESTNFYSPHNCIHSHTNGISSGIHQFLKPTYMQALYTKSISSGIPIFKAHLYAGLVYKKYQFRNTNF